MGMCYVVYMDIIHIFRTQMDGIAGKLDISQKSNILGKKCYKMMGGASYSWSTQCQWRYYCTPNRRDREFTACSCQFRVGQ